MSIAGAPDLKILPGTLWNNALRLSHQFSQDLHAPPPHIQPSALPFPKEDLMAVMARTDLSCDSPCDDEISEENLSYSRSPPHNNSQVLMFPVSLELKRRELRRLEAKDMISRSSRLQSST